MYVATDEERSQFTHYFKRLDIENMKPPRGYHIGCLDRFERVLNEDEAFHLIILHCKGRYRKSEIEKQYRKQEEQYERVFEQLFLRNNRIVYVYNPEITNADNDLEQRIKYAIDKQKDRKIFRTVQGKFTSAHSLFKITDLRTLRFFVRLSLREQCFSNFFFAEEKIAIIGNYDMSFPVWSVEEKTFKEYRGIVETVGLFIR